MTAGLHLRQANLFAVKYNKYYMMNLVITCGNKSTTQIMILKSAMLFIYLIKAFFCFYSVVVKV